jgi:transcriptional regulator with XRE-family HTH domain
VAAPQDVFYVELGKRIRSARAEKKLTQEKLATAVQLTRTSITNIEGGRQPVLAHHLVRLAYALGVAVTDLLPAAGAEVANPHLDERLRNFPEQTRKWVSKVVTGTTP